MGCEEQEGDGRYNISESFIVTNWYKVMGLDMICQCMTTGLHLLFRTILFSNLINVHVTKNTFNHSPNHTTDVLIIF